MVFDAGNCIEIFVAQAQHNIKGGAVRDLCPSSGAKCRILLRIFDVWTFFILTLFGSCFTVIIFMNRDFVFTTMMWTISMFLQQGICIIIKLSEANKVIRLRVFITYVVILIWLFNAFFVGSMFGGEFYSLFTSNRVPTNLPSNMQELVKAKEIPIYSFLTTHIVVDENRKVSSLKELAIPSMLNAKGYSPEFRRMLNDLKARIEWSMGNKFEHALRLSLDKVIGKPRHSIFAIIDPSDILEQMEDFLGLFRQYCIISSSEGRLGSLMLPWVTPRNPFGVIFEEYLGYLTEAGISDMWEKNYQKFMTVNGVLRYHRNRTRSPRKELYKLFPKSCFWKERK
ncbi:Sperm-associated antigen 17 [Folsomia candida]|uniref:Sperm-associated antigen 17 n=1 Tax=Folsomia candida TaxID=158441 RepID=A0A226D794_FOLCA|nr:Sperm-associated antigen 17 [Folsomia candida]